MLKRISLVAVIAIAIGVIASLLSLLFVYIVESMNDVLGISAGSRSEQTIEPGTLLGWVLVPALGGLVVGLLCSKNEDGQPLTLVDTIRSAQSMTFTTPLRNALATALAAIVALGTGNSVGQYGPLAHLGSSIGLAARTVTRNTGFTATMGLGCGAAAAISTAFNAPIAGLIFAHEVILRHYALRSFAPITVSSVVGYLFANHVFYRPPIFQLLDPVPVSSGEFPVFAIIGVVGAYIAMLLVKSVLAAGHIARRLPGPGYSKPAIAGAVVGIAGIWLPEVLGIGEETMREVLLGEGFPALQLATILVAKLVLTALCLGFGIAGGIFSPALFIGIMFGAVAGLAAEPILGDYFSSLTPYVICGMVAVASPVIGAPLTAILIVFELARNYDLAVAVMVSVVFANLVGYQLMGRSIFDIQLKSRGFDLTLGRDRVIMDSRDISGYLSDDYICADGNISLDSARKKLISAQKTEIFITDASGRFMGSVSLLSILSAERESIDLCDALCKDHMEQPLVLYSNTSIWTAMERVQDFVGESIPVLSGEQDRILEGVVFEASVLRAYMTSLHEVRREEYGAD